MLRGHSQPCSGWIAFLCVVLVLATSIPTFAGEPKTGEELVSAMHKKYDGKWYKTLTFSQKTINYKPDGSSETSQWYEALTAPGRLREILASLSRR